MLLIARNQGGKLSSFPREGFGNATETTARPRGRRLRRQPGGADMRYIRFKELKTLVPLGRTTIWRMEREGRFPRSRRIGKSAKAWLETEVLAWMQERAVDGAARREPLPGRDRLRRAGAEAD